RASQRWGPTSWPASPEKNNAVTSARPASSFVIPFSIVAPGTRNTERILRVPTPVFGTLFFVHASVARRAALFGAVMATLCVACTGPVGVPPDPTGPPAITGGSPSVAPGPAASPASAAPATAAPDGVVFHGRSGRHRIALTFDSNMTTAMLHRLDTGEVASYANDQVIDELEARHVPATFFLSGLWVQRYPELTRRIAADPRFELASHSYAHE